jgi:hypothetical protein
MELVTLHLLPVIVALAWAAGSDTRRMMRQTRK